MAKGDSKKLEELKKHLDQLQKLEMGEAVLAPLREQIQSLGGSSAAEQKIDISGGVRTGGGDFVGRNKITKVGDHSVLVEGNVYLGGPTDDPEEALRIYRRVVAQQTATLPLRGVDVDASDPDRAGKQIGLAKVYIDLDTNISIEKDAFEELKSGKVIDGLLNNWSEGLVYRTPKKRGLQPSNDPEKTVPLPVFYLPALTSKLVVLGDPGGGKSTFVNYIANCLAEQRQDALSGWPEGMRTLLPVVVTLRDFARSLPEDLSEAAQPEQLCQFIERRLQEQRLGFASKPIFSLLDKGLAFVLLDGLDEIPTVAQRRFVRDAVEAFAGRFEGNHFMVTCRLLSYQMPASPREEDLRLDAWPVCRLVPFNDQKIAAFITAWYEELLRLGSVESQQESQRLTGLLMEAVRRPDMRRLAPNPLLLTVMALVHTHKGRLPDARAQLYEDTIDFLLVRWDQKKRLGQRAIPRVKELLDEAERSEIDLKRVLGELAFSVHGQIAGGDDETLADIQEHQLEKALAALHDGDRNWALRVVEAIKLRAGLLLERRPEVYTFPHRTFQEYLAGCCLAAQSNFASKAVGLAQEGVFWWQVILLAVGRLVFVAGDVHKPLALVGELCPRAGPENEGGWRKAWLAGMVLEEIGIKRAKDLALGRDLLERVQHRLVDLLQGGRLSGQERAAAGDSLAELGDPRFDPDCYGLPKEPLLGFVAIPAGPFWMGSDPKIDQNAPKDEQRQHEMELPKYYISRYPVTVAQWRVFVEDRGHKPVDRESLRGKPNHPVVNVTWHGALAYCRWLAERLLEDERTPRPLAGLLREQGWGMTLPSEAEWEKAARGIDRRIYPWGDQFDVEKANTVETGIGGTSAVGCFPAGESPYQLLDMSGNVWQWTRSLWGKDFSNPEFKYPYRKEDGREDLAAPENVLRVVRGGSWDDDVRGARCACRYWLNPGSFSYSLGFRVVLSPDFPLRPQGEEGFKVF